MCRCGECFGCTAPVVDRDPGDEQPDYLAEIKALSVGTVGDVLAPTEAQRLCWRSQTIETMCNCITVNQCENVPCIGCVERCGQCRES